MVAYTHATWRIRPGQEQAFEAAWHALGEAFDALPDAPEWGTLLRRRDDATRYVSFGAWPSVEAIARMREDPEAQRALETVRGHCLDADPGGYDLVAHVQKSSPRQRREA